VSRQALDSVDDILSAKGLDATYIGPSDLSLALRCTPTFDDVDKPVAEGIDRILAKAKEHARQPQCWQSGDMVVFVSGPLRMIGRTTKVHRYGEYGEEYSARTD